MHAYSINSQDVFRFSNDLAKYIGIQSLGTFLYICKNAPFVIQNRRVKGLQCFSIEALKDHRSQDGHGWSRWFVIVKMLMTTKARIRAKDTKI